MSDDYLWEPESVEMDVSFIAGEQIGPDLREPLAAFAEVLLNLQRGIEGNKINKTIETIDLLIELAYLHTRDHRGGLRRFRAKLEGRIKPDGSIDERSTEAATPIATDQAPTSNEEDRREGADTSSEATGRKTDGSGVDGEVIEATNGETYIFTDRDGLPVLIVRMDAGYIMVEEKDPDGNIVNGMAVGYGVRRAPVGDRDRRNRWQLIGELQELIDHESLFDHV